MLRKETAIIKGADIDIEVKAKVIYESDTENENSDWQFYLHAVH